MSQSISRPIRNDPSTMSEQSWSIHGGNVADKTTGAIRTPIIMANSYQLPPDPTTIDDAGVDELIYAREAGANQLGLQTKLAALEHGEAAAVFGSGMAAMHAAAFNILHPGDHVLVSEVVYMGVRGLFEDVLPAKMGIDVDFVDITDPDAVRAKIRGNTKLVHTEVIGNPDLRVADISAIAEIAHAAGALLSVDSTFTPPPMFLPLQHGADLVIHSLTKYINGHGDATGGVVIGSSDLISKIKAVSMHHIGGNISPFNAWLIMRGSLTLPLRLKQHFATAKAIAEFLEADDRVAHVAYPGLASHPSHQAAVAQLRVGYGGIVSFAISGSHEDRVRFVNDLRLITSAVSLGHDETLIAYEHYPAGVTAALPKEFHENGLIRLAVGLESSDDLIHDLDASLEAVYGKS